ncbi:MAG TPA: hypothetical protein VGE25_06630 [Sediminibacterium sp.]
MKNSRKLGVWMDHAHAHLVEVSNDPMVTSTIQLNIEDTAAGEHPDRGEHQLHNKEQQVQSAFYKQLGEIISKYDKVILFGPTHAKTELFNFLQADKGFADITIEVKQTDKMTAHQEHAFVRDYFANA